MNQASSVLTLQPCRECPMALCISFADGNTKGDQLSASEDLDDASTESDDMQVTCTCQGYS